MRSLIIGAALASGALALCTTQAQAQNFPSHLKGCKKLTPFERVEAEHVVPFADGGGAGVVQVTSRNYECKDTTDRLLTTHKIYGLKDAVGKLIVPYDYARVLPFSTTGALVIDHGNGPHPGGLKYRTYIAGKGEGKERFELQEAGMLVPSGGCKTITTDTSPRSAAAVMGETWIRGGNGRTDVTLFTPDGRARKLSNMGGDKIRPSVRRVGNVLLARWRDDQGVLRSGLLDLSGRPVTPVLSNAALWVTSEPAEINIDRSSCTYVPTTLFIEGPSLDWDPAQPFFGPLLLPADDDGQPLPLPKGAVGMFPAFPREHASAYSDAVKDLSWTWAVVFPKGDGFEFTLHVGTPAEALIAAPTGTRYTTMARDFSNGGLIIAQAALDGKWRTFRRDSLEILGQPDTDYDRQRDRAIAILEAESAQMQQDLANARKQQATRVAEERRAARAAARAASRASGRICDYSVDAQDTRQDVEDYMMNCGTGRLPGLVELARAKGIPEETIQQAINAEWKRQMDQARGQALAEEEARLRRMQTANKDPSAGYIPGQWESAIRNAGNSAVEEINASSDNWLQQRRDQYRADWQRSQRAY
ncbi:MULTISPECIES: hypothetical protein [Asticcacaulis]|uniref:hypothetical protein n=1 Tax=Asticcacaulis TaxID=76890 RepID=UPI001AE1A5E1|nr:MULTISPECIES: hypothetical protein [Asticcacaulis]MBP2160606.1 hypothetical protein [Asticcacaulis solisilvae]MDR6801651.1 hypothetical protein [Asticcacaulis sp. BE141]